MQATDTLLDDPVGRRMSPCLQGKSVPLTTGRTLLPANLLEMLCPAHPEQTVEISRHSQRRTTSGTGKPA